MERLKRINRKTTDRKLNKKANKIEKKSKADNKKAKIDFVKLAKDFIIAVILAFGTFRVILTSFGLSWDYTNPFYGEIIGGLIKAWNISASHIAQQTGIFFEQLEFPGVSCSKFLTIMLLFLIVISMLIVESRNKWLGLIYPIICVFPVVVLNMSPSVLSVAILAGGVLLFLINCDNSNIKKNFRGLIYAGVIVIAAFVLMSVPFISKAADRPTAIDNIREAFTDKIETAYYGENPLKDGNLFVKKRETGSGTALTVQMDTPDSLYLRGFVGDVLGDEGWEALSYGTYYKSRTLTYWLDQTGFSGLGQIAQARDLAESGGKKKLNSSYAPELNEITITNKDANTKYAYIPYEITQDGIEDSKNWGNSFVTGGRASKLKSYTYTSGLNATGDWTDTAGKLFTNKVTPSEQYNYMQAEGYYNEYVYEKYTYISSEDRSTLQMYVGDSGDQTLGHVDYAKAIKNVKSQISSFTYSETLQGYSESSSPLENIFMTRNGYDAQLATAAVMMFRYYGIPARYVEGYLITQDDVASGSSTIDVPKSNAHAWAEIYVDGLGFVPIEVCSSYSGLMKEADLSVGISTKTENETSDQSTENNNDPNVETSDQGSGNATKLPNKALIVIGIIAGLIILSVLVLLTIIVVRKLRKRAARNRIIKKGEPKEAVKELYKKMDELKLAPDEDTVYLGNKATYSEFKIYEEDRTKMLSSLKRLKKEKRKRNRKPLRVPKPKASKGSKGKKIKIRRKKS